MVPRNEAKRILKEQGDDLSKDIYCFGILIFNFVFVFIESEMPWIISTLLLCALWKIKCCQLNYTMAHYLNDNSVQLCDNSEHELGMARLFLKNAKPAIPCFAVYGSENKVQTPWHIGLFVAWFQPAFFNTWQPLGSWPQMLYLEPKSSFCIPFADMYLPSQPFIYSCATSTTNEALECLSSSPFHIR